MTTPLRASLLYDDPGELIAATPSMLRFTPTDSVVVVSYTGRRTLTLACVLRMDLPAPEHAADVAAHLNLVVRNHNASVVEVVVLGGSTADPPTPPDRPHLPGRELVEALAGALDETGILLSHAIWAPRVEAGGTWQCYEDPACSGRIRDPRTCTFAAAVTVAGQVTFASREDLAALLVPDPPEDLAHRAWLVAALPPVVPEQEFPHVRDLIDDLDPTAPLTDIPTLDDPTIARLSHALDNSDIREACLAFALTVRATRAERLWTALTRAAPGPAAASPASLLAACAYLRGDGTLARIAIETALTANPDHHLATLICRVLDNGLPPDRFRILLAQCYVSALTDR